MTLIILSTIYCYINKLKKRNMGKQKLTKEQVFDIKKRLTNKERHQSIASDYGVTREAITKIKKSMTNPYHPDARWSEVPVISTDIVELVHIPHSLVETILTLNDKGAGQLIKSICKTK